MTRRWLALAVVLAACSEERRLDLADDEVAIEYVAHAAFRLHGPGGKRIVIDPFGRDFWMSYAYPDPERVEADAVFVTHPHFDHDGGVSEGQPFPYDRAPHTEPGEVNVGAFTAFGFAGRHARDYGHAFGHKNTVWKFEVAGVSIVHWGDNDADLDTLAAELGEVDVLMLPIDSLEHILYFDEVEAIRTALQPRVLVPMHYRLDGVEMQSAYFLRLGNIDPWLAGHDGSVSDDFNYEQVCDPDDETMCELVYPTLPPQDRVVQLAGNRTILTAESLPSRNEPEVWIFEHSADVRP